MAKCGDQAGHFIWNIKKPLKFFLNRFLLVPYQISLFPEMKQIYLDKLKSEAEKVKFKQDELQHLKKLLGDKEQRIFSDARKKLPKSDRILPPPCGHCGTDLQDEYIKRYAKLLKYKLRIQEFVDLDDVDVRSADIEKLRKYKKKLDDEIEKVS